MPGHHHDRKLEAVIARLVRGAREHIFVQNQLFQILDCLLLEQNQLRQTPQRNVLYCRTAPDEDASSHRACSVKALDRLIQPTAERKVTDSQEQSTEQWH